MNTKIFHSYGNQEIDEYDFDLGAMRSDQMLIRTKYTGICRSDVDQYTGKIEIPYGCFGHESVGEVVAVGSDITEFRVGDYVASRDDLAYSPYFYATETNTAKIPELHPRYITEPVACSVNIAHQMLFASRENIQKVLIVGSGFIANLTAQCLRYKIPNIEIHVIGTHNVTEWNLIDAKFVTFDTCDTYDYVLELSGKHENYQQVLRVTNDNGTVYLAASFDKDVSTNFWNPLWKNLTFVFPSPRSKVFSEIMKLTPSLIEQGHLNVDWVWTHEYDATNFKHAFAETLNRSGAGRFVRSYLTW